MRVEKQTTGGVRHNGQKEGRWINTAQMGLKSKMAKETEGRRRQEVKDRQLVKGRGGRICYRQEMNARFLCPQLTETYN